jgi:Domain of Unknown Function (DUF1206)
VAGTSIGASDVGREANRAARGRTVEWLGRAGLVAQGFSYALVGVLAVKLAIGEGGDTASRQGALRTLADETGGKLLLVLLAVGFAGYAIWRFAEALFDRGDDGDDASGLGKRAAAAGKGVVYLGLMAVTISILAGARGGGGGEEDKATAGVLSWPGGRWLVAAAGVAILAVGGYHVFRALSRKFMDDMERYEMSRSARRWTERLGVVGLLARGVVFGLIGAFLLKAAIEYDPEEAIGLDGALAKLASAAYGPVLLGVTAAGLVAFGVFCFAQARYRRI